MVEDFDLPAFGFGVVLYISYRSRANRAASSPPVPARISMTTRVRLASSPPTVISNSSSQSASRSSRKPGSSASASSRISASSPSIISCASAIWSLSCLKRRYFLASLASEPCSRAAAATRAGFASTAGIDQLLFELLEAGQFFFE